MPPSEIDEIQELCLKGDTHINHPSAMIRLQTLKKIKGYNPLQYPAADLDLFLRLGEVGKLANIKEPLNKYRIHVGSVCEDLRLRKKALQQVCKNACKRRGIKFTAIKISESRIGKDRESIQDFFLRSAGWAFKNKHFRTCIIYGIKAMIKSPYNKNLWKKIYKGVKLIIGLKKQRE
jgi:hypothetical protein